MNAEPATATVTALPPAVPSRPDLDLTPLLGAGRAWAVTVVLIVLVTVVAAAHATVVLYRKGSR